MSDNLVSIITPLHNAEEYITQTIESVLGQTYSNWELIIVDDVSSDNSVVLVEKYVAQYARVKLIRLEQNSGAAVARNAAIKVAKGRYLAFLDSDDLWLPTKLEKQLAFMQETGHPFTYTAYEKINESGRLIGKVGVPVRVNYQQLLKTCYLGCLTVMLDRTYFDDISMPLIRRRQDFGLWLRLLKKVDFAYGIRDVLGQYRVHEKSISSNKFTTSAYTWQLYRQVEQLNLLKSLYYFGQYSIRGFLRNKLPFLARWVGILR
ncbi:Putative N-acetylgalactosaminyl-diphosphoundecaprenol glucuronosyltransferase [Methylophaga frappieri]|uniref:Putative N-acetylgalactosaminyl-diphosphoundecaprenol glucuronosyltransferase n=1 Tax=Methylophaga frappieri (strain ATCC BAA-2434 / DSM 25690 / JAM7) TaxID=754477 RepID=I1YG59_METFJ|nr:glycosyltransferase family 2 protein [Methylophaga frappieri]AFJ01902.1 Putative N-acetylgalactosaminyl-diphosphoundecaprenol glucuronosyltransferase [Methylophaga frappieri]